MFFSEEAWGEPNIPTPNAPTAATDTTVINTPLDIAPVIEHDNSILQQDTADKKAASDKPAPETPDKKREITALTQYESNPLAEKAVDKSIYLFSDKIKERFSVWLKRSEKYLELMKEILRAKSVPEDIAFLPIIESGFNPNAYSVARAVGPWQFIAGTAKRYGLKIDWWRDERKDPLKSTEAAANYLKDLYDMFGSWNLAMAAYNAGEGKILKAVSRTKSDDYWALLNTHHIKKETKEYVPRFIAASIIANNPVNYGFEQMDYHAPLQYDEITLDKPIDIDIAAKCSETTPDVIRELNPELRRWSTPANAASYKLKIPAGRKDVFMENLSKIPEQERFSITVYTVKKGDTIKKIANKAGVPVNVVLELNNIRTIRAGETIYLPPKNKFSPDRDDKARIRKATLRHKKRLGKKVLLTRLNKKDAYIND